MLENTHKMEEHSPAWTDVSWELKEQIHHQNNLITFLSTCMRQAVHRPKANKCTAQTFIHSPNLKNTLMNQNDTQKMPSKLIIL